MGYSFRLRHQPFQFFSGFVLAALIVFGAWMGWQAMADTFWSSATRTSLAETNQVTFLGLLRQQFGNLIDVHNTSQYPFTTYIYIYISSSSCTVWKTEWYNMMKYDTIRWNYSEVQQTGRNLESKPSFSWKIFEIIIEVDVKTRRCTITFTATAVWRWTTRSTAARPKAPLSWRLWGLTMKPPWVLPVNPQRPCGSCNGQDHQPSESATYRSGSELGFLSGSCKSAIWRIRDRDSQGEESSQELYGPGGSNAYNHVCCPVCLRSQRDNQLWSFGPGSSLSGYHCGFHVARVWFRALERSCQEGCSTQDCAWCSFSPPKPAHLPEHDVSYCIQVHPPDISRLCTWKDLESRHI